MSDLESNQLHPSRDASRAALQAGGVLGGYCRPVSWDLPLLARRNQPLGVVGAEGGATNSSALECLALKLNERTEGVAVSAMRQ